MGDEADFAEAQAYDAGWYPGMPDEEADRILGEDAGYNDKVPGDDGPGSDIVVDQEIDFDRHHIDPWRQDEIDSAAEDAKQNEIKEAYQRGYNAGKAEIVDSLHKLLVEAGFIPEILAKQQKAPPVSYSTDSRIGVDFPVRPPRRRGSPASRAADANETLGLYRGHQNPRGNPGVISPFAPPPFWSDEYGLRDD